MSVRGRTLGTVTETPPLEADAPLCEAEPTRPRTPGLSPSRANDYMQCPLLFRFRVVDRLPEPPSPAAVRGTLVHAVLERLFDHPSGDRTIDAALTLLRPCWDQIVADRPDCAGLVAEGGQDAWFAQAEALLRTYFTLEDPNRLEPAERELAVSTDLDGFELRGIIDRVDVAPNGAVRIVDYKTGRSPGAGYEASALFQMRFYAAVLRRLRGTVPAMLQLIYLGDGTVLRHVPDEAELATTEAKVRAVWSGIQASARDASWEPRRSALCSWCAHQSLCPLFGGTPPEVAPEALERALGVTAAAS